MTSLPDELRRLAGDVTPGPWRLHATALGVNPWIACSNGTKANGEYVRGSCILNMVAHDEREVDAALIVLLRNNLPTIIAALEAQEKPPMPPAKPWRPAMPNNIADRARPVWPTSLQNQVQAMFDADKGVYSPLCEPTNSDGEAVPYCGECGRIAATNPDNDLCAGCEAAIARSQADGR